MLKATIRKSWITKQCASALVGLTPILKNFLFYSGGSLLLRSVSVMMAPITMSMISPDQYGMLALLNSFISISCVVCGFGLRQALSLEYFHYSQEMQVKLVRELIQIYSVLAVPLLLVALLCHQIINHFFFLGILPPYLLIISIVLIFLYFFSELFYQLLQYEHQALQLTLLQSTVALITILINIHLLYFFNLGITSIIIGQLIGIVTVCSFVIQKYNPTLFFLPLPAYAAIKKYLYLGLPFIPSMLFAWLLAAGDRWVLARYATLSDVGIYSVADTFGQLFQMTVLLPFSNAYLPYLMKKFAAHSDNLMFVENWNRQIMWLLLSLLFLIFSVGYLITKPLIVWLLPSAYHDAISYIWLLLVGYLLLVASYFPAALIQFKKKTIFLACALCIPAITNVLLNMVLVPYYNIGGCVFATVCSYGLYFMIMLGYNYRIAKRLSCT